MRGFKFMRRLIGLVPRDKPRSNHVEPSKPWPRKPYTAPKLIVAPPHLVETMQRLAAEPAPSIEEVDTQMKFSAAMAKCLDAGMSYEDAKEYVAACADDIKAGINTPWRRKLGENRFEGLCGCIFNGDGERVIPCRDH
jgi:hypothetical protein